MIYLLAYVCILYVCFQVYRSYPNPLSPWLAFFWSAVWPLLLMSGLVIYLYLDLSAWLVGEKKQEES